MTFDQLFQFCLKSSESDLLKYLMITAAIFRHETSEWLCYKISEYALSKYGEQIEELILKYGL